MPDPFASIAKPIQDPFAAIAKPAPAQQPAGTASAIPENYGFTAGNMASNAWEGVKGLVTGAYGLGKDVVNNPNWVTGDDSTLSKFILQPAAAMKQKAQTAKTPSESLGYSVAEALPIVGPWAASLGEQAGTGDIGGAAAKGVTQALAPKLAGKAIGAFAEPAKAQAVNLYTKALNPTTKINKALTAKVVPELLDKGEWGSLKGISEDAQAQKAEVGPQIDDLLQARGDVPQAIKPTMDALDGYKQQFLSSNGTVLNKGAVSAVETLQGQLTDMASKGDVVPTKDLVSLRRILDDQVARAGGYAGATLADGSMVDAMREGAGSIRSELAKSNPDLAVLNQKYSFWSNVQKVADATIQRRTGQLGGLLGNGTAEAAGAIVDGVKGGATGAGVNLLRKGYTSPMARTARAVAWNKLGNAISAGKLTNAARIARNLGVAGNAPDNSPTNSLSSEYNRRRDMTGIE
jgi:hypothetical protein